MGILQTGGTAGNYSSSTGGNKRQLTLDASLCSSVYQNVSEARVVNFAINYFIKY